MTWNTNITEAQTGDYVWLALPCGRVVKSYWIPGSKAVKGQWAVRYSDEEPVAWMPYPPKPIHPFELAKQEESAA